MADLPRCFVGHATHPQPHTALALAAAQIDAQHQTDTRAEVDPELTEPDAPAVLGLLYVTEPFAPAAEALLDDARQRWPGVSWAGASGIGVLADGAEYIDEPALAVMWIELPPASFTLFSGRQPLAAGAADTALVHADPGTPELTDLIEELAGRTGANYLFGGLACGREQQRHWADEVFSGGLSGVGFGPHVRWVSRVTQGCQPAGPARRITQVEDNLILELDGEPALPLLLDDLGLTLDHPREALAGLRHTLVGLTDGDEAALNQGGQFGSDTRVRHLIGIDPTHDGVAVGEHPEAGQQLTFCRRNADAARRDLVRICAELREALDPGDGRPPARIAGAVYISCSGRGGPYFGRASAEAQILRHALGDVPTVGFFAAGEIAHHHLYGYTGVLAALIATD
jgi:small ligand-binding sensory domain FIST